MANVPPKSNVLRTGFFANRPNSQKDVESNRVTALDLGTEDKTPNERAGESDRVTALKIAKASKQPTSNWDTLFEFMVCSSSFAYSKSIPFLVEPGVIFLWSPDQDASL